MEYAATSPVRMTGEVSLARGDAEDFATLVRPHLRHMALLAERLSGPTDRDDVVQEALIRAWVKRDQFDPRRGTLVSWLLAITADRARRTSKRKRRSGQQPPRSESGIEERLDVERALSALPPRQRLSIDCYYFAGLSVAETAVVMGCSEGTVKSTLSDARSRLKRVLTGDTDHA